MANHMAEVAKMLGVELGEPFMVGDYKYHFTEKVFVITMSPILRKVVYGCCIIY